MVLLVGKERFVVHDWHLGFLDIRGRSCPMERGGWEDGRHRSAFNKKVGVVMMVELQVGQVGLFRVEAMLGGEGCNSLRWSYFLLLNAGHLSWSPYTEPGTQVRGAADRRDRTDSMRDGH